MSRPAGDPTDRSPLLKVRLRSGPGSADKARRSVRRIASSLRTADRHDLALLAGELAATVASVRGSTVTFDVLRTPEGMRAELHGFGRAPEPDPATVRLLDELSSSWEVDEDFAWFEVQASDRFADTLDERRLFEQVSIGDGDARDELVRRYRGFARMLARRFRSTSLGQDDLDQVAAIGLLKAIDRFDPGRGVRFTTYASRTIEGELKRHLRDAGWSIRVPRGLQELGLRAQQAAADLTQRTARAPTLDEIAEAVDAPPEEVGDALLARRSFGALSLDASPGEGSAALLETLPSRDERLRIAPEWARLSRFLRRLPSRERTIVYLRYFRDLSQSQIARRVGISQMHVSRLLRKSIGKLREMARVDRREGEEGTHARSGEE